MRQIADQLADSVQIVEKNYDHRPLEYVKEAANWRTREKGERENKEAAR